MELIDMRNHSGEHPRLGAVDVCPFIPLRDSTMSPVRNWRFNWASVLPQNLICPYSTMDMLRRTLVERYYLHFKGEYEGLKERFEEGESAHGDLTRWPDDGPRKWTEHVSKFGAVVIGSRPILVAYNVNLDETDARVARPCGTIVRSSGRLIKSVTNE